MKAGFNQTQTADFIGADKSPVSREVRRNRGTEAIVRNNPIVSAFSAGQIKPGLVSVLPPGITFADFCVRAGALSRSASGSIRRMFSLSAVSTSTRTCSPTYGLAGRSIGTCAAKSNARNTMAPIPAGVESRIRCPSTSARHLSKRAVGSAIGNLIPLLANVIARH